MLEARVKQAVVLKKLLDGRPISDSIADLGPTAYASVVQDIFASLLPTTL